MCILLTKLPNLKTNHGCVETNFAFESGMCTYTGTAIHDVVYYVNHLVSYVHSVILCYVYLCFIVCTG